MTKVKVAHIANTDFFIKKLMLNKLIGLKDLGYEVHAITPPGSYEEDINNHGIPFHGVFIEREISLFKDIRSIFKMAKLLKKEQFDIVHTHSAKAGVVGRIAAKMAKTPIIIHTAHGLPFYEGQNKVKFTLYKFLEKVAGKTCDVLLSQNKQDMNNLIKYKIGNENNVFYEGNGVNIQELESKVEGLNKDKFKKSLRIEDKLVIGFYARLEPVKGHLYFLDAFKEIVKTNDNIVCLLAGGNFGFESKYEEEVRTRIKDLGLQEHIKILGFREDIPELLSITDILVLPSEKEGIPRIVMEAMTLKISIVATDVLGTRELVVNQKTGLLVPYKDIAGLKDALVKSINDKELRIQFGINGRKRVEKEYNEDHVINRLDNLYNQLVIKKLESLDGLDTENIDGLTSSQEVAITNKNS